MNRPHYAWLVCLGGALTLLSTVGLGVNVFAVYQPEMYLEYDGGSNVKTLDAPVNTTAKVTLRCSDGFG